MQLSAKLPSPQPAKRVAGSYTRFAKLAGNGKARALFPDFQPCPAFMRG